MAIQTNPNAGTLLRFRLPPRLVDRGQLVRPDGRLHGLRVLVVDDNAAHRDILRRYLSHWGVSGRGAASADEALAFLRETQALGQPFHLAILDLAMPEADGFDLADAIERDPDILPLPLVLLTAFDQQGQAREARARGFSAYLTKPVKHLDLLATLQALTARDDEDDSA
ncbi:MAG: response regulator [Ardenticatenia bacterium]|nr:response regulator [Ardenticatenia bacterium]